ncbi:MAG: hypothetical protein JSW72_09725 [Candidatus Bathyarchaeota archaeon]|nr:MAG: hypothetical protein JSW72_09725 [Candidatus Bathyarchaeota archaeon]
MTDEKPHALEEEQERGRPLQFMKWILEAIISPIKAFEKIVRRPDIRGPILILLITLPITLGGQYISGTKFFLEIPTSEDDLWTEEPSGQASFLWESNNTISFDDEDFVTGNSSVSTSLTNGTSICMQLKNIGSFSSSEEEHSRLLFRMKWVHAANTTPTNATLQLTLLENSSESIQLSIENYVANRSNTWANVSVSLSSETSNQKDIEAPANITGVSFLLQWNAPANLTLKIDELFFGAYSALSTSNVFTTQLAYLLMQSSVQFLLQWVILSGIALLLLKSFSHWTGPWRNLLATVGYVYSPSIIYSVVLAFLFALLPPVFFPYFLTFSEYLSIQSSWGIPISIVGLLYYGWLTILCGISLKSLEELSWRTALLISFGAVIMSLLLSSFLLSAFL